MQPQYCYCKYEFSLVFNFVILCYLQNLQKLHAHKKLVFYSMYRVLRSK